MEEKKEIELILEPEDEYNHEPDDVSNYNESMYFNLIDHSQRIGGWFRLGNRVNENYAEMTCCIYLPNGRVGFMYKKPEIQTNDVFDAGGMRFEVVEPFKELKLSYEGKVCVLDKPNDMAEPKKAFTENIPSNYRDSVKPQNVSAPLTSKVHELKNPFVIPGIRNLEIESQLNPNYSFDNFLEGDANRLARSAGFAVSNKPGGTSFNPLLIFGGVGLGKTHLLHSIGNQLSSENKKVVYLHSEKFVQNMVTALRNNQMEEFKKFYRNLDVLLLDDMQFFAGKERSQEEFFDTFNALFENKKQYYQWFKFKFRLAS